MANLKEIRRRLASIRSTHKITTAMRMIASAKLRPLQMQIPSTRYFVESLETLIQKVILSYSGIPHPFLSHRPGRNLLIVFTSDQGLCGGFNSNLVKEAREFLKSHPDSECIVFGRKGQDALKDTTRIPIHMSELPLFLYNRLSVQGGDVFVMSADFHSVLTITPHLTRILPFSFTPSYHGEIVEWGDEHPLHAILMDYLTFFLKQRFSENRTCELACRMNAMDHAARNARDMIQNLHLLYNRSRQSIITKELIEIVSGAEAIMDH